MTEFHWRSAVQRMLDVMLNEMGLELCDMTVYLDSAGIPRELINELLTEQIATWIDYDGNHPSAEEITCMIHGVWDAIDITAAEADEMDRAAMLAASAHATV